MKLFFLSIILSLFILHRVAMADDDDDDDDACYSIRDCSRGLVCASGNPRGSCVKAEGIIGISHLISNLIQEDYSGGSKSQDGPLRASRAISIIYLAAHDAYAVTSGAFKPKLQSRAILQGIDSNRLNSLDSSDREEQAILAMQVAGFAATKLLYARFGSTIDAVMHEVVDDDILPDCKTLGELVGRTWFDSRRNDGSQAPDLDNQYTFGTFLRHQPDPNYPIVFGEKQTNFGRTWPGVKPFILKNIERQTYVRRYPSPNSSTYRRHLEEVKKIGQCNNLTTSDGTPLEEIGNFWGYDAAPKIGVPPRMYIQTALGIDELYNVPVRKQLRALTGMVVAMSDANIAAFLWKFKYDLWRPVIGIRNATSNPDKNWSPIGIALSNTKPTNGGTYPQCIGINPNFPAYPSGHASAGTAAFKALARILFKSTRSLSLTITSDEFNGRNFDKFGKVRRVFTQKMSLQQAIDQNKMSRIYLGIHWRFDADAGDIVGTKVASVVAREFRI